MAGKQRPRKEIDGITWWWCSKEQDFQPETSFHWTLHGRKRTPWPRARCIACRKLDSAVERQSEHYQSRIRAWTARNENALKSRKRQYYRDNRDRGRERERQYRQDNLESIQRYQRKWREKNKEHLTLAKKAWAEANPDKVKRHRVSLKAARQQAVGSFTARQFIEKCEYWAWRCYLCGVAITRETLHAEHRIPLSRGGTNWIANIAPSCKRCNLAKGAKTESEYRQWLAAA